MLESSVVSVFIQSDRLRKRIPRVGEMVRREGSPGLFTVRRVDQKLRVVDLLHGAGHQELEESVSFNSIRTLDKEVSVAVQNFLKSSIPLGRERTKSVGS